MRLIADTAFIAWKALFIQIIQSKDLTTPILVETADSTKKLALISLLPVRYNRSKGNLAHGLPRYRVKGVYHTAFL